MSEKITEPKKNAVRQPEEAVYTMEEFAVNASKIFGKNVNAACVMAAFKVNGVAKATVPKAKEMVQKFISKEVK